MGHSDSWLEIVATEAAKRLRESTMARGFAIVFGSLLLASCSDPESPGQTFRREGIVIKFPCVFANHAPNQYNCALANGEIYTAHVLPEGLTVAEIHSHRKVLFASAAYPDKIAWDDYPSVGRYNSVARGTAGTLYEHSVARGQNAARLTVYVPDTIHGEELDKVLKTRGRTFVGDSVVP